MSNPGVMEVMCLLGSLKVHDTLSARVLGAAEIREDTLEDIAKLQESTEVEDSPSMAVLREKSLVLTTFFEVLLNKIRESHGNPFRIITPADPSRRGAMLCLKFEETELCLHVFNKLEAKGIVLDYRKPNVLRLAPVPLYNTYRDVFSCYEVMQTIFDEYAPTEQATNDADEAA